MSAHPSPASGGNASQGGLDNIRMIVRRAILGFTAVVIVMTLLIWHPWSGWFAGTEPRAFQTATTTTSIVSASDCSGKSQSIDLGPSDQIINGGAECDMVGWDIDSPVVLVSDTGYEETFTSAHAFSFRAAHWRAANGSAHVTAVFCPPHTVWNGVDACS